MKQPKEKAKELVDKFYNEVKYMERAKQCAIISVDEILLIKKEIWDDFHSEYFDYWQQVKQELINLKQQEQ
jgi:hypothetical protein